MTNIILCGGSGTRLWPVSRLQMPKQFVKLFDDRSLFQMTVQRNLPLCEQCMIVSNTEQFFLASDQLEEIDVTADRFLLEPFGRNTAPALALACFALAEEETVLVTPSDHLIRNDRNYMEALQKGEALARQGLLVTFGISPSTPETGYGYIERGEAVGTEEAGYRVRRFHEKPDIQTARHYIESDAFYWNSGIFCFTAGKYLSELKHWAPEIYERASEAFQQARQDRNGRVIRIPHEAMESIPESSIDYAVMERSRDVAVVPCDPGWNDLGSFDALYRELPKDTEGNTLNPNHLTVGGRNNLILGSERLVATVDVEDLMIVDSGDALLVAKKGSSEKVRDVVRELERRGSSLPSVHLTVHRPWGTYTVLENTEGYKIKRIVVKPGKRLSLQKHFHRSEHWIVVSGTATVTVGDEVKLIRPNESTYIKIGQAHRLANEGKIPVVLIEAQVGEYTGEDDILRLDDDFSRS